MKYIVTLESIQGKLIAVIGSAASESEAFKIGLQYLDQHGIPRDPFYRHWTENNTIYCDFGSWSQYLIIRTEEESWI